ncbi:MAG: hypothetical protein ACYTBJ_17005, partial [Planctomycetota bacterium]
NQAISTTTAIVSSPTAADAAHGNFIVSVNPTVQDVRPALMTAISPVRNCLAKRRVNRFWWVIAVRVWRR